MKKLLAIITVVSLTAMLSLSAFAATGIQDPQQALESVITTDTVKDLAVSTAEVKDDTILKSDVKSFRGKFVGLMAQLNLLRTECKGLWSQIKTSNQSIKTAWSTLKTTLKGKNKVEVKKILADIKTKIDPLRVQVTALHNDIKTIRTQKTAEWTNFRAAVKARDEVKATTALNSIIRLKTQIIEKQKAILPLKQSILAAIK